MARRSRSSGRNQEGPKQSPGRIRNLVAVDHVFGLGEEEKPKAADEASREARRRRSPLRSRVPAEPPQYQLVRLDAVGQEAADVARGKRERGAFKRGARQQMQLGREGV